MAKQTFTTGQVLTAAQMTSLQQTAMGGGSTTAKTSSYVLVAADAGTVVQMNSASATTITVNTALFAAGDTVQIQNVGSGVCTVTAGTATVSTSATLALKQYDAGDLYFNSTSAAIFFASDAADSTSPLTTKGDLYTYSTVDARLAVGANNTILTADSAQTTGLKWAAPAAATFVGVNLSRDTTTSLTASTVAYISYPTEIYDTNTFHDNTNPTRITIPTGYGGRYLFTGFIGIGGVGSNSFTMSLRKNGTTNAIPGGQMVLLPNNAGNTAANSFGIMLELVAADYIELGLTVAATSASYNVASLFQATYLGA